MFNNSLNELLKRRNVTQTALAEKFNLTPTAINKWVAGVSEPDFKTLCKLAEYFKVSADYLLGRTESTEMYSENAKIRVTDNEVRFVMDMRELSALDRKEVEIVIKIKKQVQQNKRG